MPAEWEPHEATWISWPHPDGASFPSAYERVVPVFVEMVKALVPSEIVRINVRDAAQELEVRARLNDCHRVEFFHVRTNEPWCRDHGPIFLKRKENPRILAVSFGFNAWGYKLAPFEDDEAAATLMAGHRLDAAAVWPQFRGPNGAGVAESAQPPVEFGPATNLLWKTALPAGKPLPP